MVVYDQLSRMAAFAADVAREHPQTTTVQSVLSNDTWAQHLPTPALRFARKDGKKILQQMWQINTANSQTSEWRDVPIEEAP